MLILRRRLLAALVSAAPVVLFGPAGCAVKSPYMMMPAMRRPIAATPTTATVVFLRPYDAASGQVVTVVDGKGGFIGDSLAKTYFSASFPPGEHIFCSLSQNTDVLRANLAEGRVYFVFLSVDNESGGRSGVTNLFALTPRSQEWSMVETWLAGSKQMVVAPGSGSIEGTSRYPDIEQRLKDAKESLTKFSGRDLVVRTLRPEDGL